MLLPPRDSELTQIVDAAFAEAARRAGAWLLCRPGCTQCCHGVFAIDALDAARLRAGRLALRGENPALADEVEQRAQAWVAEHGADFPGDLATGRLGASEEDEARFEEFANEAPCPALDPATGRCDLYAWRPMTCRVFGPPVRTESEEGEGLGHCELCFGGATPDEIAACEMPLPLDLEADLLAASGDTSQTVVAFALLPRQLPQQE